MLAGLSALIEGDHLQKEEVVLETSNSCDACLGITYRFRSNTIIQAGGNIKVVFLSFFLAHENKSSLISIFVGGLYKLSRISYKLTPSPSRVNWLNDYVGSAGYAR